MQLKESESTLDKVSQEKLTLGNELGDLQLQLSGRFFCHGNVHLLSPVSYHVNLITQLLVCLQMFTEL